MADKSEGAGQRGGVSSMAESAAELVRSRAVHRKRGVAVYKYLSEMRSRDAGKHRSYRDVYSSHNI